MDNIQTVLKRCPRGVNSIVEVQIKVVDPATVSEYCEPEFITTPKFLLTSLEREKNTRQLEIKGLATDIMFVSGRLIRPRHWDLNLYMGQAVTLHWLHGLKVSSSGRARILPQFSSRLGLERRFGGAIRLEVEVNDI